MNAFQPAEVPTDLTVVAYPDATVEAHGFGPEHPYIEQGGILPLVGPSATLMWKRLARQILDAGGNPVTVDTADLMACLGLGASRAKNSPAARTVARIVAFDLARRAGRDGDILAVRTALAPVTESRLHRLPLSARRDHDHITRSATSTVAFGLGKLHVTPAAIAAMARAGTDPTDLLDRHQRGDWGDVDIDEALANNGAVTGAALLHSIYNLAPAGTVVWVLTSGDRRSTTITTPDEY